MLILYLNIIFRSIIKEKLFNIVAIIGIASGVALFISVYSTTESAVKSFKDSVDFFSGAKYTLRGNGKNFIEEEIYKKFLMKDIDISPVITLGGKIKETNKPIVLNGIDIFRSIRNGALDSNSFQGDLKDFFDLPSVIISQKLLIENNKRVGDNISIYIEDKLYSFKIAGTLSREDFPKHIIFMDIAQAQEALGLLGYISQIDIYGEIDKVEFPPDFILEERQDIFENRKDLIKSFNYNLFFISLIAILVGFFLMFNTVLITVIRRKTELGILRAIGFRKKEIVYLFLLQSIITGVIGSILGLFLGSIISGFSMKMAEKTISTVYEIVSIDVNILSVKYLLVSLLSGVAISIMASILPVYEASKVDPINAIKDIKTTNGRSQKKLFLAGSILIVTGIFLSIYEFLKQPFDTPFLTYSGTILLLLGFTLITPFFIKFVSDIINNASQKNSFLTLKIAESLISANIYRFSIAVISVAVSSALVISILVLIFSFKTTLSSWIDKNIDADIYIKPLSCTSNFCFDIMSRDIFEKISSIEGIGKINRFRVIPSKLKGKDVLIGFGDVDLVMNKRSGSRYSLTNDVAISDHLARKYFLKVGSEIELSTPKGLKLFKVREIFQSFSSTKGLIILDRFWLHELWGEDTENQISVYINDPQDINKITEEIRSRISNYAVDISNNRDLRENILKTFDQSFAITRGIQFIALVVSIIGVLNTITAIIWENKRDINILSYLGADRWTINRIFLLTSFLSGIIGATLGTFLGAVLVFMIIKVVNVISFGWEISIYVPYLSIALVISGIIFFTLITGFYPSIIMRKVNKNSYFLQG